MVTRPRIVSLLLLIMTVCAGLAAFRLKFEFSPQSVYDGQDALIEISERHKELFGFEDAVIVVVLESKSDDLLTPDALAWQKQLAEELTQGYRVESVSGLVTLRRPRLLRLVPLVPDVIDETASDRVRAYFRRHELLHDVLLSEDARLALLFVEFDPDARSMDQTRRVVAAVRGIVDDIPRPDGCTAELTGISALRVDVVQNLQSDQLLMFPLSGAVFLVVVILIFRDTRTTLLAVPAVFCGVIWALGLMAILGQSFNLLSNVVPTLTLIIGAANCVHIISRARDEQQSADTDDREFALRTMNEMSITCLLTFLTTAIGFGSLLISKSVILRQFALQASLGLICEYFSVVLVLSCGLAGCRPAATRPESSRITKRIARRINQFVSGQPRRVLLVSSAIVLGCIFAARTLKVDSFLYETYDASHPAMMTIRKLDERMSGLAPIEVRLTATEDGALFDSDVFRSVLQFQQSVREHPDVRFARSYVDLHLATAGENSRELTPEGIGRMKRQVRRAGQQVRRERFVTEDDRSARILLRISDIGSARMNELIDSMEAELARRFPPSGPVRSLVTGDAYLHARCMDQFVRDLFLSLLTASVAIFAVISLLFRSLRTGFAAAIPNLTPLAVTLGYIALRGYSMTAGTVIVFAISLGIAVDDTIHFLSRFREESARSDDRHLAIQRVFDSSGRAIILTTGLIVSGLSVLLLSQFVPTRRFAELTTVTMGAALIGDLFLLPAWLLLFGERPSRDRQR